MCGGNAHQRWPGLHAACSVGEARHLGEGALLMPSPRGGRTDNGWRTGDELCHQTRGLKDGPLECYQSCLDQDVRLSRSSVFPLQLFLLLPPRPLTLPALLPPSLIPPSSSSPFAASPASSPPLLPMASFVLHLFLFPLPPSSLPPLPSFCLVFSRTQGPLSCQSLATLAHTLCG